MSYESRKITLAAFLSLVLMTGCSSVIPGTEGSTSVGFEQTELAGLKFSKVSEKNATMLNNLQQVNTQTAQPLAAPVANASVPQKSEIAPADASVSSSAGQAVAVRSDMAIAPKMSSSYMGYFPSPGPFEEYVMINFEEATSAGFTGTYLDTLTKVVKPVITAWSKDAKLTSVNGSTDPDGKNLNPEQQKDPAVQPYYYSPYQWQFSYISVSKKEVYNIFVSSTQTVVLRQKWVLKDLNPDETKIDSNQAIKIVTDKISDKTYSSPDNQEQYKTPNSEILYSIPEKATWYFYLSQEKEGLIWNVNFNINNPSYGIAVPMVDYPPMATDSGVAVAGSAGGSSGSAGVSASVPQKTSTYVWYSGGYAKINAKTGEILSLSRPVKYTETYYPYYPETKTCDEQGNCTVSPDSPPLAGSTTASPVAVPKPL